MVSLRVCHLMLGGCHLVKVFLEWAYRTICGPQMVCMSVQPIDRFGKHGRQMSYSFISALELFLVFPVFFLCCLDESLELIVRIFTETFRGCEQLCGGLQRRVMAQELICVRL